jgi:hypothetical protein
MYCERNQESATTATLMTTTGCLKDIFISVFWKAGHNPLNVQ